MGNLLAPPWLVILSWGFTSLIVAINASLLLSLVF
jgi:hypothetical protein